MKIVKFIEKHWIVFAALSVLSFIPYNGASFFTRLGYFFGTQGIGYQWDFSSFTDNMDQS